MNFCEKHNCTHCCIEADVPLLSEDIDRLTAHGYYDVYFSEDYNGAKFIRKIDGKCIFFKDGACEVYDYRPKRCWCPQIAYDEKTQRVLPLDSCLFKNEVRITQNDIVFMEHFIEVLIKEIGLRINYNPAKAALGKVNTNIKTLH